MLLSSKQTRETAKESEEMEEVIERIFRLQKIDGCSLSSQLPPQKPGIGEE